MSFNSLGKQPAPLDKFLGLVTLANPSDVAEGASPRCHDNNFSVGSTTSRGGLLSSYSFAGQTLGPNNGSTAVDVTSSAGQSWTNPSNIIASDGSYTSIQCGATANQTVVPTSATASGSGATKWTNPANVFTTGGSYSTVSLTLPVVTAPVAVSAPLPPFNSFKSAVGQPKSGVGQSLPLLAAGMTFSIPTNGTMTGLAVVLNAFATGSAVAALTVQFTKDGAAVGSSLTFNITSTNKVYAVGGIADLLDYVWTPDLLNAGRLGLEILAVSTGGNGTGNAFSVNSLSVVAYYNAPTFSDPLQVTGFNFSIPSTQGVTGFVVKIKGYQALSGSTVTLQMMQNGVPVGLSKDVVLSTSDNMIAAGSSTDTWGANWGYTRVNNPNFGVQITVSGTTQQFLDNANITVYQTSALNNFNWVKTFEQNNGNTYNLAVDSAGNFFREDVVNAEGVLSNLNFPVLPGSFVKSVTAFQREFMCFSDLQQGQDVPRKYDGINFTRISQVGPGVSPTVVALNSTYVATSATQVAAVTVPAQTFVLVSQGPGSTVPGNTLSFIFPTTYTLPSYIQVGTNIVIANVQTMNGWNPNSASGSNPAYYTVTQIGTPASGATTYYGFSVTVPQTTYFSALCAASATFQSTQSTLLSATQIPTFIPGSQFTLAGTTQATYNASWTVQQLVASGTLSITNTSITAGLATYTYTVVSGSGPSAGQYVTVNNTTNAGGIFNGANLPVVTVSGETSFTVAIAHADVTGAAETGNGIINGFKFTFDPKQIITNATGGTITPVGSIVAGTRRVWLMFLTSDGYLTAASLYPTVFTTTGSTTQLVCSNLATGPSNVVARWVAISEAGQQGVPGANPYVITKPNVVNGISYGPTVINDNITTTATFTFRDLDLLGSLEVDVQGRNQLNLIELGSSASVVKYAGRNFYFLTQNKVTNFNNTTFDGGYVSQIVGLGTSGAPVTGIVPAGWTSDTSTTYAGTLVQSAVFGLSFYVQNLTGSTQAKFSMITQGAAQDYNSVPIIDINTTYSVRLTARCPSQIKSSGSIVIDLYSPSNLKTYGTYTLPLSGLGTTSTINTGTLLTTKFTVAVPTDLQLRLYGSSILNNSDYEIDRFEVFDTNNPVLSVDAVVSYNNNLEAIDNTTGFMGLDDENSQTCYGGFVMYDQIFFLKENSMFSSQDSAVSEPNGWGVHEVSNKVGACGIHAFDTGEEWAVVACRAGVYVFFGGQPIPISKEIWQVWEAINWNYGYTIVVRNDIVRKELKIHVPMATPNFWLPDAPVNANPTSPNVMLVMNYLGLDSVQALADGPEQHVTMFGTLAALDMRRKWTIWQVASPYSDFVKRSDGLSMPLFVCNGTGTSKIYSFDDNQLSDDGTAIPFRYTTYGFIDADKAKEMPMFGLQRKLYTDVQVLAEGSGSLGIRAIPNNLSSKFPYTVPNGGLGLSAVPEDDYLVPLNVAGQRIFMEFTQNAVGSSVNLSKMIMLGKEHPWLKVRPNSGK